MNEEHDLELDFDKIEADAQKNVNITNRIQKLSEKVKNEAQAREEVEAKLKAEAESRAQAEKERDFFKNFSGVTSKYPNASDFQDQIWEKVKSGYSEEDAAVAILAREGKLQQPQTVTEQVHRPGNIVGGSAATVMPDGGEKRLEEMSTEEKRNQLLQMEREGANLLKL